MNKNKNERANRRAELLGMPYGTASGRLRKNILFYLLSKYRDNICYVCKNEIKIASDLSIEHIQPWEGRSAELFWDLENIAFSHSRCNKPHNYNIEGKRKYQDDYSAWCCYCKVFLSKSLFDKCSTRWNGVSSCCKKCKTLRDNRQNHIKV